MRILCAENSQMWINVCVMSNKTQFQRRSLGPKSFTKLGLHTQQHYIIAALRYWLTGVNLYNKGFLYWLNLVAVILLNLFNFPLKHCQLVPSCAFMRQVEIWYSDIESRDFRRRVRLVHHLGGWGVQLYMQAGTEHARPAAMMMMVDVGEDTFKIKKKLFLIMLLCTFCL